MAMRKWTRRAFLRDSTLASLLAPVVSFWPDLAEAQAIAAKKHMLLVFMPNGKTRQQDFIRRNGGQWSFAQGFTPYNRFIDDAIAFEQYAFQPFINTYYEGDHRGHIPTALCMFSGEIPHDTNPNSNPDAHLAPSLDQIVAWDYLDRGIITNPLRKSLNIKISGSSWPLAGAFWQAPADFQLNQAPNKHCLPVTAIQDPQDGFDAMFGGFSAMAGSTREELWTFGKSLLDVPAQELERAKPLLPSEGRRAIDEHLASLRDLERDLQDGSTLAGSPPARPPSTSPNPNNHEQIVSQWAEIIDAAFRLDRTRIATMQFGGIASRFSIPTLGTSAVGAGQSNSGSDHHSYTHHAPNDVHRFLEWYADRVVEILDRLKGTHTGQPNILADSVVMVGCEFGQNHKAIDVPVTIFGQAGGALQTGQTVTFGNDLDHFHKHTGTLLSVARAMGCDRINRVGTDRSQYQQGPIQEILT